MSHPNERCIREVDVGRLRLQHPGRNRDLRSVIHLNDAERRRSFAAVNQTKRSSD